MKRIEDTLLVLGFLLGCVVSPVSAAVTNSVRLVLPSPSSAVVRSIGGLFARQILQRCEARVVTAGDAPLTVELAIVPDVGAEGFRLEDRPGGGIKISGHDERGLLYGVGTFLRTSRYDQGGFTPGEWRGTSVPQKPVRGIYCATHFHKNHHMRWWPGELEGVPLDLDWFPARGARPRPDPGAEEAYATVQRVDGLLSPPARTAWRWRVLFLRTLLDAEL